MYILGCKDNGILYTLHEGLQSYYQAMSTSKTRPNELIPAVIVSGKCDELSSCPRDEPIFALSNGLLYLKVLSIATDEVDKATIS